MTDKKIPSNDLEKLIESVGEERFKELQELSQDPFQLIMTGAEMLGWAIAIPVEQNKDEDINVLMVGRLDKMEETMDSDSEWEIFRTEGTVTDGDIQ